jgi:hypothetical protein
MLHMTRATLALPRPSNYNALVETLKSTRAAAYAAQQERDAIESCVDPRWLDAHRRASRLYRTADEIAVTLARDPSTRYGSWRTAGDRGAMECGAL